MRASSQPFAFALVEVVIALGIVAYALVGIIGLLSVAYSGSKGSLDDTVLVMIVNGAVSDLRRERFSDLAQSASTSTSTVLPGSPFFYDVNGMKIANTGSGIPANAVYHCAQAMQIDPDTMASGLPYLLRVRLHISWPAGAPAPANTKTVYVDIAKR